MKKENIKVDYEGLAKLNADVIQSSFKGVQKEYWYWQRQWRRTYLPENLRLNARVNMKKLSRIKSELQFMLDMKIKVAA